MNKTNMKRHLRRTFFALAILGALTAGAALTLPKAEAGKPSDTSYGPGAVYQIELVAGDNGTNHGQGGGIWLWIALYPDGTGDYSGSDCLEQGGRFGLHGAYPDAGDVTWNYSGGSVVISGVLLKGLSVALGTNFYATITVPRAYGHYTGTLGTFMTFSVPGILDPNAGTSLVQVAGGAPGTTP